MFNAFNSELGAPVVFAQLARQYEQEPNRCCQVVRESQRRMAAGAKNLDGTVYEIADSDRYLVVTHDLPLDVDSSDGARDEKHLTWEAEIELGSRISLAICEHLLGEP